MHVIGGVLGSDSGFVDWEQGCRSKGKGRNNGGDKEQGGVGF